MKGTILNKSESIHLLRLPAEFEDQAKSPLESTVAVFSHDPSPAIYSVVHDTIYEYSHIVDKSNHLYRVQPVDDLTQSVLSYELKSSPAGDFYNFTGVFGNNATVLEISEAYNELRLRSSFIVAVSESTTPCGHLREKKLMIPLLWMPWDRIMMQAYLLPEELPESELIELSDYAMSFVHRNKHNIYDVLQDINDTIFKEYKYKPFSTSLATTPYEVFISRQGVCQDFSNLFICLARLLNIPARYRVGYLYTGGEYSNLRVADQTHAWVEVYLPGIGWQGFDPTNGCRADKNHIRVACGRHYRDATPTSGVVYAEKFTENMTTSVRVIKLNYPPTI